MCGDGRWATDDPLGIGGLLSDAARLASLILEHGIERRDLLRRLLREAGLSLLEFTRTSPFHLPAEHRLAFRELGLSIGIHGLRRIADFVAPDRQLSAAVERLLGYKSLAGQIEAFWSNPAHRLSCPWLDHHDINSVMLATSLAPEGYLKV